MFTKGIKLKPFMAFEITLNNACSKSHQREQSDIVILQQSLNQRGALATRTHDTGFDTLRT